LNSCGVGIARCFSVTARAGTPGSITGPINVCKTNSAASYSIAPVFGALTYSWSITGGATLIPSGTSTTVNYLTETVSSANLKVTANNVCGSGQPSQVTVVVNLGCRELIPLEDSEIQICIFPNPAHDQVTISIESETPSSGYVKIINSFGQILHQDVTQISSGMNVLKLDLQQYSKGIFLIMIQTGDSETRIVQLIID